jgi:hypothetical protein
MLPPAVCLLHIFEKGSKVLTLTFSSLELDRHDTCDNIIAMLKHLPR